MEKNKDIANAKNTQEIFDWVQTILFPIIVVVLLFTFLISQISVSGWSMSNTLDDKDHLIIFSNTDYQPKYGDIVVVSREFDSTPLVQNEENSPIIKRVIATAGQTVNVLSDGSVTVNGKKLNEPYVTFKVPGTDDPGIPSAYSGDALNFVNATKMPYIVPAGDVFVMGDNRNNSMDSRYAVYSKISIHNIIGHAVVRVYSSKSHSLEFQLLK